MSDNEDHLFGDSSGDESDDTADLFAQSGAKKQAGSASSTTQKKKPPNPKKRDEGDDLFDSDSDDDDESDGNEAPKPPPKKRKELSKREKMEALARKKRKDDSPPARKNKAAQKTTEKSNSEPKNDGYESEDSVDSAQFERTEEDNAFIDTTGEDEEAIKELYAAQHFDQEEDDMEDRGTRKKRKYRNDEAIEDGKDANPLDAAMMRLKKKKREKKGYLEMEAEAKQFLAEMQAAAESDEQALAERKPGLKKLQMLNEVVDMMKKRDYVPFLIDADLLSVVRRWIQPLPNGHLGNVTVRKRLLETVASMPGIDRNALKRSELGKTVMALYKHPMESPDMKRQTRELIEQWSRGIFQKSGNMRDLEHVHHSRGERSIAAYRQQQNVASVNPTVQKAKPGDLKSMLSSGKRGSGDTLPSSANRVRVPFSKGFAYSVRPINKTSDGGRATANETRVGLAKRMMDKAKKVGKNQRSANISIEGRPTKG
jgi:transcription factor SPN1